MMEFQNQKRCHILQKYFNSIFKNKFILNNEALKKLSNIFSFKGVFSVIHQNSGAAETYAQDRSVTYAEMVENSTLGLKLEDCS